MLGENLGGLGKVPQATGRVITGDPQTRTLILPEQPLSHLFNTLGFCMNTSFETTHLQSLSLLLAKEAHSQVGAYVFSQVLFPLPVSHTT